MAAKRNRRKGNTTQRENLGQPSKWRLQHGDFGDAVREADPETGTPVQHRYAIDTLGLMLNNGTITREMHDAGAMFRKQFRIAALEGLRVVPLDKLAGGRGAAEVTDTQVAARKRVAAIMTLFGGPGSPAGACIWHVVGLEASISEWARREGWGGRPIGATQGQGVLVCALGVLAAHYGLAPKQAA